MVKIRSLLIREWVFFIGLILLVLFGLWWWGFIRLVDVQAAGQATSTLQGLDREIQARMEVSEDLGSALAALWTQGMIRPGVDPGTPAVLHALAIRERDVSQIALVDAKGDGVLANHRSGEWTTSTLRLEAAGNTQVQEQRFSRNGHPQPFGPPVRIPGDYRMRPWYVKARGSKGGGWTSPYLFQRIGAVGVTYAIPVWSRSGQWLGAIGVDLLIEDLNRGVWGSQPTKHSRVTITDGEERAIALPRIPEFGSPDSRRAAYLKTPSRDFLPVVHEVERRFRPGRSEGKITVDGNRYFVARRFLNRHPGINWRVYLAIPEGDLLTGPRRQALWALGLALLLVAAVSWRMSVLAGRFADPLARLAEGSQAFSRGEPLLTPETNIAEIRRLGAALEASARTIEEKRQLEEQLQRSQRLEALGHLAGGIAHDVNNFLGGVLAHLQLADVHAAPESPAHLHLSKAKETATRCGEIMMSLLTFAKPVKPAIRNVDLNGVALRVAGLLDHARGKGITVRLDLSENLPPVLADPVQLEQVVMNLGLNGRDAMPSGGRLTLSTGRGGEGQVFIRVADTGTGIAPDVIERLFEPFFTTKGEGGTGLGLSMAFGMVRAHGGTIQVDSEPGLGSAFTVLLPIA